MSSFDSAMLRIRSRLAKTKLRAPLVWIRHQTLSEQDALIACYPRSGSTWFSFMLYEVLTGEEADFRAVDRNVPYVGKQLRCPALLPNGGRLARTHELHAGGHKRAIYLARDVRDVVISEYFYERFQGRWDGSLEEFVRRFASGRVNVFGSWTGHVNAWLDAAAENRIELMVIKYEDLRSGTEATLERTLDFLGVNGAAARRIVKAIRNNAISKMREKENCSPYSPGKDGSPDIRFVRKGSVGGWRLQLKEEQLRVVEEAASDAMSRLGYQRESYVPVG